MQMFAFKSSQLYREATFRHQSQPRAEDEGELCKVTVSVEFMLASDTFLGRIGSQWHFPLDVNGTSNLPFLHGAIFLRLPSAQSDDCAEPMLWLLRMLGTQPVGNSSF